jgi:hypothetical protein
MKRALLGVMLLGSWAIAIPVPEVESDDLLTAWHRQQAKIKTLLVVATFERHDGLFSTKDTYDDTFRYLMSSDGEVMAALDRTERKPNGIHGRFLWRGGTVYYLDFSRKHAIDFGTTGKDVLLYLRNHFCPLTMFLDRKRAAETYRLEIAKQDGWYTYLKVERRKPMAAPGAWSPFDAFYFGQVVFPIKASENYPAGMPCQICWASTKDEMNVWQVKSWSVNARNGPAETDFVRPEAMPGWEVVEWPWK